jgi:hypothetical protein
MSRKISNKRPQRQPSYRLHKARNCAVVTINGINKYLGPYDSPESHEKYARLIAEWKANGSTTLSDVSPPADGDVTINLLVLRFLEWAETYYVKHGQPTGEVNNLGRAASALKQLYGRTPAKDFGPPELEAVQRAMIDDTLARKTINGRTSRIKRMFRWASRKGLDRCRDHVGLGRQHRPLQIQPNDGIRRGDVQGLERLPGTVGHQRAVAIQIFLEVFAVHHHVPETWHYATMRR